MIRKRAFFPLALLAAVMLLAAGAFIVQATPLKQEPAPPPLSASFTYQGQLTREGTPYTGQCDFAFSLWTAAVDGKQVGASQKITGVAVTEGIFTARLNSGGEFGAKPFDGTDRYIDVSVQCAGDLAPTALGRQPLTSAPYALNADLLDGLHATDIQATPAAKAVNADLLDGKHAAELAPSGSYYPINRPQVLDLKTASPSLGGFFGGFSDGRYAYFVPALDAASSGAGYSGLVARVDPLDFTTNGITTLNLTAVNTSLRGFRSGFTDGRFAYFVPNFNGAYNGLVARVDLQNFTLSGVTILDLTTAGADLRGFYGGFSDSKYAYFVPFYNEKGFSSKLVRVDEATFSNPQVLDLSQVSADLMGFVGGFSDGRYGYLVPSYNGPNTAATPYGKLVRFDLANFTPASVTVLDLTTVNANLKGFQGGFTDGRYAYLVPTNGKAPRIDLQNFTASGVTFVDLALIDPMLSGFGGGFMDGRYAYYVPDNYQPTPYNYVCSGKLARIDLQNFTSSGVSFLDMTQTDPALKCFMGGFSDGRYGYMVPWNGTSGKVGRILLFNGNGTP